MAEEKKKTVEQLEKELATAKSEKSQLEEVVEGQNAELERLGAEKSTGAKVISVAKTKYKVLVPKSRLVVDGAYQEVLAADLEKKENKHLFDALMKVPGQAVLEEV